MTASTETPKVVALHGTKPMSTTPQTRGMERRPRIDSDTAGAKRIWMGQVTCLPTELGPPHHHGEAETAAYVLSGHIRVYFGDRFQRICGRGTGR